MASKTLLVAQRELLENVRTKTFWVGILAFPILLVVSIGATWFLNRFKETQHYAVLDLSQERIGELIERTARSADLQALGAFLQKSEQLTATLGQLKQDLGSGLEQFGTDNKEPDEGSLQKVHQAFQQLPASDLQFLQEKAQGMETARKFRRLKLTELGIDDKPLEEQQRELKQRIEQGKLFAYFVIGRSPTESVDDFEYVSNNVTDNSLRQWYATAATKVVQDLRIKTAGIDPALAKRIQEQVRFREQKIGEGGQQEDVKAGDKAQKWAPVVFVYLLWIAVFTAAQMLLTNTVEEKSNRIIEVLLSSVSPLQLMSGKIWGIAATGMTIVGSWVLCAMLGVWLTPKLLSGMDISLLDVVGNPLYLGSFLAYFLAGYLLYAAILVGIGSVCNSLKEAQNLLQPVFLLLIVPLVSMMFVVQEPNGTVARVLSFIPLFTPFTMMNRAGGPPELWEYVATSALLLASVWLAFHAAGKIFRVGVLMTGNPPRLKEILGWLRER